MLQGTAPWSMTERQADTMTWQTVSKRDSRDHDSALLHQWRVHRHSDLLVSITMMDWCVHSTGDAGYNLQIIQVISSDVPRVCGTMTFHCNRLLHAKIEV